MLARGSQMLSVVFTTMQALIRKASRARSGGSRWNSNDSWRLIIVLLYCVLMMIEWQASR